MDNKVCIVTGCDRGIGKEIALGLAKRHYHIVMACVDVLSAEKARIDLIHGSNNEQIEIMYIDLGNIHSVNDFCDEVKRRFDKIDILINNAGVMMNSYTDTIDGFEAMFQINYLSAFHLTCKLLPLLSRSLDGRVLNISTKNFKFGKSFFSSLIKKYDLSMDSYQLKSSLMEHLRKNYSTLKYYGFSKYLFIVFSAELGKRVRKWGYNCLNVMSVDTGIAKTQLANDVHQSWKGGLSKLYFTIHGTTPEKAAVTPLFYALEPNISRFNGMFCTAPMVSKDVYLDPETQQEGELLWTFSTKLLS